LAVNVGCQGWATALHAFRHAPPFAAALHAESLSEVSAACRTLGPGAPVLRWHKPYGFQTVAIVSCGELSPMAPPNRTAIRFLENQSVTTHGRRTRGRHSLENASPPCLSTPQPGLLTNPLAQNHQGRSPRAMRRIFCAPHALLGGSVTRSRRRATCASRRRPGNCLCPVRHRRS
jgi:hypothetical protein